MRKIILISFFNFLLFFNTTSLAKTFYIGDEVNNIFDFNRYIKIKLDSNNWEVVRVNRMNHGLLQRIVGIARVENNEIMESQKLIDSEETEEKKDDNENKNFSPDIKTPTLKTKC